MARRGIPETSPIWYLQEWMAATGFGKRGGQTKLRKETGWSKAKMSQLYNGEQDFNSVILTEAAKALKCREHELLMHPQEAMGLRAQRSAALQIVRTTADENQASEADSQPALNEVRT